VKNTTFFSQLLLNFEDIKTSLFLVLEILKGNSGVFSGIKISKFENNTKRDKKLI
jgi:hypothetical protein